MKFTLPSGQEAQIGIAHRMHEGGMTTHVLFSCGEMSVSTQIVLATQTFCKADNRKKAAEQMLDMFRHHGKFSKADRREIFLRICPQFRKQTRQARVQVYETRTNGEATGNGYWRDWWHGINHGHAAAWVRPRDGAEFYLEDDGRAVFTVKGRTFPAIAHISATKADTWAKGHGFIRTI